MYIYRIVDIYNHIFCMIIYIYIYMNIIYIYIYALSSLIALALMALIPLVGGPHGMHLASSHAMAQA